MSATVVPEGWTTQTSANGVEHAVTPAGACATCGRDHRDWPHERPTGTAAADVETLTAQIDELRALASGSAAS